MTQPTYEYLLAKAILGKKLAEAQTRWLKAHDALQDGLSSFDLHNDTVAEAEQSLANLRAALAEWNKLEEGK